MKRFAHTLRQTPNPPPVTAAKKKPRRSEKAAQAEQPPSAAEPAETSAQVCPSHHFRTPPSPVTATDIQRCPQNQPSAPSPHASPPAPPLSAPAPPTQQRPQQGEAFSSFYLRKVTAELADDLDKVRQAGDFRARTSLPMLIHALQQGEAIFSAEEKGRAWRG